ncbi:Protein of unknown function [Bacillus cereus]|nr:Protein of unknown function [Bacillus cereus]
MQLRELTFIPERVV